MSEPMVIVVAAVVVREGRLLLARRPAGTHLEHHWELPGGKVEPGEAPPDALRRELREELAVDARLGRPFAFNYHAYPSLAVLLLTYLARLLGEPRPAGCAELRWFAAGEIPGLMTPAADAPIFEKLLPLMERNSLFEDAL